jgi:hypothetical protein
MRAAAFRRAQNLAPVHGQTLPAPDAQRAGAEAAQLVAVAAAGAGDGGADAGKAGVWPGFASAPAAGKK